MFLNLWSITWTTRKLLYSVKIQENEKQRGLISGLLLHIASIHPYRHSHPERFKKKLFWKHLKNIQSDVFVEHSCTAPNPTSYGLLTRQLLFFGEIFKKQFCDVLLCFPLKRNMIKQEMLCISAFVRICKEKFSKNSDWEKDLV